MKVHELISRLKCIDPNLDVKFAGSGSAAMLQGTVNVERVIKLEGESRAQYACVIADYTKLTKSPQLLQPQQQVS